MCLPRTTLCRWAQWQSLSVVYRPEGAAVGRAPPVLTWKHGASLRTTSGLKGFIGDKDDKKSTA